MWKKGGVFYTSIWAAFLFLAKIDLHKRKQWLILFFKVSIGSLSNIISKYIFQCLPMIYLIAYFAKLADFVLLTYKQKVSNRSEGCFVLSTNRVLIVNYCRISINEWLVGC